MIAVLTAQVKEFAILFLIVIIHELGHAVAAVYYKWRIVKIELLPFGGVAVTEEHGNKPIKEEVIVILAGPIQHIWMGAVMYALGQAGMVEASLYELFMMNNTLLFLFNLLPIWPLDGGKLLFNGLTAKIPFVRAHLRTIYFSVVAGLIFFLASLLFQSFNLMLFIVMLFVGISLYTEWKQHPYIFLRFLLERYYGKEDNVRKLKILPAHKSNRLMDIFRQFFRGSKHTIIVENGERYDENELLYAYFSEKRIQESIGDLYG
ncbi:MAG: M50 family metallopeptidase [Bacillaceae bacterium]